jgi:hypothetical protein
MVQTMHTDSANTLRKSFKYKLRPTPEQEQLFETTLRRCRTLYNAALEQRRAWWQRGQGVGITHYQQNAELPEVKAAFPEFAEVHSQVLQNVLLRLDQAYQAFFRRVRTGEKAGFPRFRGSNRYNSFTYLQVGDHGGARFDNGFLVLARQSSIRWPSSRSRVARLHQPGVQHMRNAHSEESECPYTCLPLLRASLRPRYERGA